MVNQITDSSIPCRDWIVESIFRKEMYEKIKKIFVDESDSNNPIKNTRKIVSLIDLGGKGKTFTAAQYFYFSQKEQNNRYKKYIWLNGSKSDLSNSLKEFAIQAKIFDQNSDQPDHNIKYSIKVWLKDLKEPYLLVLDNLEGETWNIIEDFIPEECLGHILLTTRYTIFDQIFLHPVSITEMTDEESKDLLAKTIGGSYCKEIENVNKEKTKTLLTLTKKLGKLPLAVVQAGYYIKKTGKSIEDYLDSYETSSKKLLEDKRFQQVFKGVEPVAITWKMNFDEVKNKKPNSEKLLKTCSFLDPAEQPYELLKSATDITQEDFEESVEALYDYSLINMVNSTISVHQLVQEVTQYSLLNNEDQNIVSQLIDSLLKQSGFQYERGNIEKIRALQKLLPHAMELARYIDKKEYVNNKNREQIISLYYRLGVYYLDHENKVSYALPYLETANKELISLSNQNNDINFNVRYQLAQCYVRNNKVFSKASELIKLNLKQELTPHQKFRCLLQLVQILMHSNEYNEAEKKLIEAGNIVEQNKNKISQDDQAMYYHYLGNLNYSKDMEKLYYRRKLEKQKEDKIAEKEKGELNKWSPIDSLKSEADGFFNGYSYRLMLNDSDSAKDREIGFCVKNNKVTMKINGKEDVSLSDKKETEVKKICKTIIEANNRQDKTFTSEEIEDFLQSTLISRYTLFNNAINNFKQALKIKKNISPKIPLEIARTRYQLGSTYFMKGNYSKAKKHQEESLKIKEEFYGNRNHIDIANNLRLLGETLRKNGDLNQAITNLKEAIKIFESFNRKQDKSCKRAEELLKKIESEQKEQKELNKTSKTTQFFKKKKKGGKNNQDSQNSIKLSQNEDFDIEDESKGNTSLQVTATNSSGGFMPTTLKELEKKIISLKENFEIAIESVKPYIIKDETFREKMKKFLNKQQEKVLEIIKAIKEVKEVKDEKKGIPAIDKIKNDINYIKNVLELKSKNLGKNLSQNDYLNSNVMLHDIIKNVFPQTSLYQPFIMGEIGEKEKALIYSQEMIVKAMKENQEAGKKFEKILKIIKKKMDGICYSCFISYAWPTKVENGPDIFIQPFLEQLRKDLSTAGFNAKLDYLDVTKGDNIEKYMTNLPEEQHWLMIGTPSLTYKFDKGTNVRYEIDLEKFRIPNENKSIFPMIPVLVSGTALTSLPLKFHRLSMIDLTEKGYVAGIKELLLPLTRLPKETYESLWNSFTVENYPGYMNKPDAELVKQYWEKKQKEKENQKKKMLEQQNNFIKEEEEKKNKEFPVENIEDKIKINEEENEGERESSKRPRETMEEIEKSNKKIETFKKKKVNEKPINDFFNNSTFNNSQIHLGEGSNFQGDNNFSNLNFKRKK